MIVPTSYPGGLEDGFISVEGGIDAGRDPSLLSPTVLSMAQNATFRGGMAKPRPGIKKLKLNTSDATVEALLSLGRFQGCGTYLSLGGTPFLNMSISGKILSINLNTFDIQQLTTPGVLYNNPNPRKVWFCQAERFQVIQDSDDRPLIWDGAILRRANQDEVPTGGPMAYGLGRLWVGIGPNFVGGDIIYGDPEFGPANLLRFTENDVINEGGAFTVPWQTGNVTGMSFTAKTDTASGEGSLMVFTANGVFEFDAPVDRTIWKALQQPIQRFALLKNGSESHESIVQVNGDLFFRSVDGIRSFYFARREWNTWANTPVSREVEPIMKHDDTGLLYWCSAVNFDNRLITLSDPIMEDRGTVWRSAVTLDFDLVSGIGTKIPPCWDGKWVFKEKILQICTVQGESGVRAFAVGFDEDDVISVWELTRESHYDVDLVDGDEVKQDIPWELTTRSMQFTKPVALKVLKTAEFWVSELEGNVNVAGLYRADVKECWSPWAQFSVDANWCKLVPTRANCWPTLFNKAPVRTRVAFPEAPVDLAKCNTNPQNSNVGYEFQVKLKLTGHAKIRRFRAMADELMENEFGSVTTDCDNALINECESCYNADN